MRDLHHLDLNLLMTLDALLDERNVTRAADRLALTQPAVSAMLTRLRESFNDPLFVRAQRGVIPTARALELAQPVKRILHDIQALLQPEDFDPRTSTLTVTLAATDYALRAIVEPFTRELRKRAPAMRLAVRQIDEMNVRQLLEKGEIDLAIVTTQTAPQALHARRLYDEEYVCAMRAQHPAAGEQLSLERFCELDQALVSYFGDPFHGAADRALAEKGLTRRVSLSVDSFLFLVSLLKETDLLAVVPRRLLREEDKLLTFAPPLAIPGFTKAAAWHERTHHHPAHRWLREVLFEVCGEGE
ncbi:LysR family transcriptional regulator [Franconibacter sp. IITDAS19]|uniref:LysR family transcriptional regulator n=1 Tax=Franconibacter sp. IITDAS19 TaxID=2930569 RepID=UPI001FF89552|nr:LysR family transcriptional regulator [Franconibacter sp. IITDAS19]MCK1968197.1 LysR family transcriptional regulator [Franconibacter sp. IITDAS19]